MSLFDNFLAIKKIEDVFKVLLYFHVSIPIVALIIHEWKLKEENASGKISFHSLLLPFPFCWKFKWKVRTFHHKYSIWNGLEVLKITIEDHSVSFLISKFSIISPSAWYSKWRRRKVRFLNFSWLTSESYMWYS